MLKSCKYPIYPTSEQQQKIDAPIAVCRLVMQSCHTTHDRDINAALNIKRQGLLYSGRGTSIEPVESPSREAGIVIKT